MSYRSLKRLLGETSLERKCRLLLGGGIFVLVLVSFFSYGYQAEKLVWDQTRVTGQLLVNRILLRRHSSSAEFEDLLPEDVRKYTSRFLRPGSDRPEYQHRGVWEHDAFLRVQEGNKSEISQINKKQQVYQYLGAVRLQESCMKCHPTALDKELGYGDMKKGDLIAAVSLEFPLSGTELALNVNRAILLSFGFVTAIVGWILAYVIVRYVIVKPVAHLKDVSDEIASGNLTVRSNIQTGDEFQELSHAFNRMLRSLVAMQDELRKVNTDLDQKLDELARANMALFEMNRLKSDFLATISHELRTPLNSILGFGDLLAAIPELQPKQQRWVQNILQSGKSLLGLINDILDLAKLEAGKMQVHLEEFSLRDLVEGQLSMTRPLADKKNIALSGEVDSTIPILRQDGSKLEQIISNLLSNAIKFTPEGGQIKVICKADRGHVVLSVIDNGVGIAPQDQKLIFEKFRQAESSLTRQHGGTGLGLSIVRELTKLLGGEGVELESELGRGSTFTVRLPMHLSELRQHELRLGDEALDFNKTRESEVRFYTSRDRVLGADI
ncbi:MAG: ATP-binding protein [Planctomycetota bacterium]